MSTEDLICQYFVKIGLKILYLSTRDSTLNACSVSLINDTGTYGFRRQNHINVECPRHNELRLKAAFVKSGGQCPPIRVLCDN